MNRTQGKSARLEQIERLLLAFPKGLTQAEIARRCGVHRSTINRSLQDLADLGVPVWEADDGRLGIDREAYLTSIRLRLDEAMAVFLAARLLARYSDKPNQHTVEALLKLGVSLDHLAPQIGRHIVQTSEALRRQLPARPDSHQQRLETLTRAWSLGRKIRLRYLPLKSKRAFEETFAPYFLEPSAIGYSTYAIGHSDLVGKLRTRKLERMESVTLTEEPFEIPADFDPVKLLSGAWGIWFDEEDAPTPVKLKFSPAVARRVQESRWHPSQRTEPQSDSSLIWTAEIDAVEEFVWWVRGWGADCEVLAPEALRKALEKEARRIARLYGVGDVKPEDDLIAHRRERDGEEQSLFTHLTEASQLAEGFAAKVGLPEIGKLMGLLHDFGKASKEFQDYLRSATGLKNPDEDDFVDYEAKKGKIDHSTAGAQLVYEKLASRGQEGKILAQFLALAMASHHSGLIDCLKTDGTNEFQRRIEKPDKDAHLAEARSKLPDIEKRLDEILAQPIENQFFKKIFEDIREPGGDSQSTLPFKHGLLARFLLSCLLDADRLNTADFENAGNEAIRNYGLYVSWDVLIERLETKFAEFARETAQMEAGSRAWEVNQLRAQVAQACLEAAAKPKGIYQLTVPTGGGKTLASLRFALHHARAHTNDHKKIERIFYIVPYITIIDQNADKVREILEKADERDKVVLEHHSNFVPSEDTRRRHNLLAENWDAPIVFTTQVQFLEALFGSGTRDARRMHQLANSVIIFDEVQTIPVKLTHMFTTALRFLTHDCGATVVLCTATQPPFDNLPNTYRELNITREQHIIQNEEDLFKRLKRVEVHDERKPGGLTNAEIADLAEQALQEKGSVLIVVNTRALAQALYQEIKNRNLGAATYHLSTNMCPAHRVDKLEEIKAKLKADEPVICVSTQLIEAGVDIDFGAVVRALAGLDSIAQSAGRCNRHGEREGLGSVWVVNPQEENLDQLKDIKVGRNYAQQVLDDFMDNPDTFGNDRIGLDAVAAYYNFYYHSQQDKMDYPVDANSSAGRNDDLFSLLSMNTLSTKNYQAVHQGASPEILLRQSFRSAAGEFHVIDSPTRGVIVPYKDGDEIIKELCGAFGLEKQGKLLKQAQRYSVNLFTHQFDKLFKARAIQEVQEGAGIYYLDKQYYSEAFGWSDEPVNSTDLLTA